MTKNNQMQNSKIQKFKSKIKFRKISKSKIQKLRLYTYTLQRCLHQRTIDSISKLSSFSSPPSSPSSSFQVDYPLCYLLSQAKLVQHKAEVLSILHSSLQVIHRDRRVTFSHMNESLTQSYLTIASYLSSFFLLNFLARVLWSIEHAWLINSAVVNTRGMNEPCSISITRRLYALFLSSSCRFSTVSSFIFCILSCSPKSPSPDVEACIVVGDGKLLVLAFVFDLLRMRLRLYIVTHSRQKFEFHVPYVVMASIDKPTL